MHHTIVVLLIRLHCNAMPACAVRLEPKTPAPCMQPTANTQQRAYTCLLHGHAKHAANSHAMQQLCAECAYMRVLFSVPIPYQLGLTELAQPSSKAPRGSVPAYVVCCPPSLPRPDRLELGVVVIDNLLLPCSLC